jgi:hypothetical protein
MAQFVNPIAPDVNKEKAKSPWDYRMPHYDERSSCYMDAGTHYGVGFNNPVGHDGPVKQRVATMPFGHKLGMESDEAPRRMLHPDMME